MPPSQLKRLKTSLREQGVTGPQKSKKQKKQLASKRDANDRVQRNVALQQIRDSFNPFELRQASRPAKFESVSRDSINKSYKEVLHRPGVSKSVGEDARRATLLPEMRRRNKVGGLVDRRFGEGDEAISAEERALQRFAKERGRKHGMGVFDLEASDGEGGAGSGLGLLTHGGRSIADLDADDFKDTVAADSDDDSENGFMRRKRRRSDVDEENEEEATTEVDKQIDGQTERKKSKKEVMEEVIAKSKMHKYERQKVKEDDDDLRAELDAGTQDLLAMLRGRDAPPARPVIAAMTSTAMNGSDPHINPDRQKLLDGMDRNRIDKDYEARLRQYAQDVRAKPSERTKTSEEKATEEAERLKKLEERRLKRMHGETVSDEEESQVNTAQDNEMPAAMAEDEGLLDEAAEFGFTQSNVEQKQRHKKKEQLVLEDEDEFDVDEDLIGNASDADLSESEFAAESGTEYDVADAEDTRDEEEEDEFVKGILDDLASTKEAVPASKQGIDQGPATKLAYTYPCPRSHEELLAIIETTSADQIPVVVQRIRALHHPSLSASNKEAMSDFSAALVDHIAWMGVHKQALTAIEQLIRHLHSLSRTYANRIAESFRNHLLAWHQRGSPTAGDLVLLTAVGSIYPTSDHFHQVVTPAITLMARYLTFTEPYVDQPETLATGAFMVALCTNYQTLSRRYVPEAVRFTLKALSLKPALRKEQAHPHLDNLLAMTELWKDKSAFIEIFTPFVPVLQNLKAKKQLQHLQILLNRATLNRRPLELHHHRKQPIRTSVPKFEEAFNPDKHYDPDKERSEAKRLQKEYKRERKGALRELRKDANFVAREQLREKRERDAEYERKYRRLVAEVQGEEGHAAKEYAREKAARKRKK